LLFLVDEVYVNQKPKKNYRINKKAFDAVMSHYRSLLGIGSISAMNMAILAKGSPNPTRPTPLDFRCDVDKVIKKIVPARWKARFIAVYILTEGETDIEHGMLAHKIFGGAHHSFEQRMGEQFVTRKLHPVQGRGYFHTIRKAEGKRK
jgi:hypothetical protein